jgi:DNA-binding helix-hairpin-helix protein with protein kinase domain
MKAQLENGCLIDYFPNQIAQGSMKDVYLTQDRASVLCFYQHQRHHTLKQHRRLQAILTVFNPTLPDKKHAKYWSERFCWPTAIITQPTLGVMLPLYPQHYFFAAGRWQGLEKKSRWFVSPTLRRYLPQSEQGNWLNYYKISLLLARTVSRLHLAGLAHSDLSDNNVLIDPVSGQMRLIDLDTLVVPRIFPPEVEGTPGYIAPEVLTTLPLSPDDAKKQLASILTDQHALAVLIYEYLLNRHPLRGPKIHSSDSAEEDERLSLGEKALFIEHPLDRSNAPKTGLTVPVTRLGASLTRLFYQAFVTGLHHPHQRPTAYQWERGLIQTWDTLHPCPNPDCSHQWFIVLPKQTHCPFCQTPLKTPIPILTRQAEKRPGEWMRIGELVVYHGQGLFKWHVFDHIFPGPGVDNTLQAYCVFYQEKWVLINQALTSMISAQGHRVKINQAVELKVGEAIRLSQEAHGCQIVLQNKFCTPKEAGVQNLFCQ